MIELTQVDISSKPSINTLNLFSNLRPNQNDDKKKKKIKLKTLQFTQKIYKMQNENNIQESFIQILSSQSSKADVLKNKQKAQNKMQNIIKTQLNRLTVNMIPKLITESQKQQPKKRKCKSKPLNFNFQKIQRQNIVLIEPYLIRQNYNLKNQYQKKEQKKIAIKQPSKKQAKLEKKKQKKKIEKLSKVKAKDDLSEQMFLTIQNIFK